jgi:transcriptional regulator with GAF, ATPase, and Fis domain
MLQIDDVMLHGNSTPLLPVTDSLEAVERGHILRVLQGMSWVIEGKQGAAARLGLHPNTLRSRMQKLGIKKSRPTA